MVVSWRQKGNAFNPLHSTWHLVNLKWDGFYKFEINKLYAEVFLGNCAKYYFIVAKENDRIQSYKSQVTYTSCI